MSNHDFHRRAFHRLSLAAIGGLLAGTVLADPQDDDDDEQPHPVREPFVPRERREKHICRGLNSCKGHGSTGKNHCAGIGTCATVPHIPCATMNECKNMGGCGARPGENECKGRGGGEIPLLEDCWPRARARFEERMKKAGKKFRKPTLTDEERISQERLEEGGKLSTFRKRMLEEFKKQQEQEEEQRKREEAEQENTENGDLPGD